MADYKSYLAASVLSEEKVVTYRLLSRALKVHVNAAKEMLYEFHRQQNGKKPGTIHATYLVSGTKRWEELEAINGAKDSEDQCMQSSPFTGGPIPQPDDGTGESSTLTISLTAEEDLENLRSHYEHITAIQIYSIGPHPFKDLQLLSDSARELQALTPSQDPLESLSKYGAIINPAVKRRSNRRPPTESTFVPQVPAKSKPVKVTEVSKVKAEPRPSQSSSAKDFFGKGKEKTKNPTGNPESKESTPNPPTLKKEASSIFKSFAKAKPKLERKGTDSSALASAVEDEPMIDVSDDEEETYVPPVPSKEIVDNDRKNMKEREEALKRMMEENDGDEDELVPTPEEAEAEEDDAEVLEDNKVAQEPEPTVEVKDGRRRGRRRVMKKKTVKDEEGYLVTKEETVWESFSEDEPVPPPKPKAQSSSTTLKGKKPAAKAGQGNIMSFFGKK